MELIDVLRGRWLALAIAVPILAGIIALTLLSAMAEQRFTATATVSVPQAIGSDPAEASLRTLLEDFSSAFTSRRVAELASEATGRSPEGLLRSLEARPTGNGSEVVVSLEGQRESDVRDELVEVSRQALSVIAARSLEQALLREASANQQVETALAAVMEVEEAASTTDLLTEYRLRSADVQALRTEIARAFDSPGLQAALDEVYEEKLAERDQLGRLVTEWELRRNRLTEASAARDQAERDHSAAERVLERVRSDEFSLNVDVDGTSAVSSATVPTLSAMVTALAAVVLLAVLSNRRSPTPAPSEELRRRDETTRNGRNGHDVEHRPPPSRDTGASDQPGDVPDLTALGSGRTR